MKLTILGNNGPFAKAGGACSSYLLQNAGKNAVIDMVPGSLAVLQKYIDILDIDAIIFSHLHYDHMSDVFSLKYALGLLRAREGFDKKIRLFLPKTPENCSLEISNDDSFEVNYIFDGFKENIIGLNAVFFSMTHPVETYAVSFEECGKRFVYSGDTTLNDKISDIAKGAELYLVDGGLLKVHEGGPHMTVAQACKTASYAKKTVVTHLSPLYLENDIKRELTGNAVLAQIGQQFEI